MTFGVNAERNNGNSKASRSELRIGLRNLMGTRHSWNRPRCSTLVVATVVAAVLALIAIPAERVDFGAGPFPGGPEGPIAWSDYEHGWPLTYLWRSVRKPYSGPAFLGQETQRWSFTQGVKRFSCLALLTDFVVLVTTVTLVGWAWEWRTRRLRVIWQFSLLGVLCFTAFVAGLLGWWRVNERAYASEQRAVAELLERWDHCEVESEYCGPSWLRRGIGKRGLDLFSRVVGVCFYSALDDHQFAQLTPYLRAFSRCEHISLHGTHISDPSVMLLASMPSLQSLRLGYTKTSDEGVRYMVNSAIRELDLEGTQVTDAGMVHLGRMKYLQTLSLVCTGIGDAGLRSLIELKELEELNLSSTKVTDVGIRDLASLGCLEKLDLSANVITDAGLKNLEAMPSLRYLDLTDTYVTKEGIEHLRASLPELEVRHAGSSSDESPGSITLPVRVETSSM